MRSGSQVRKKVEQVINCIQWVDYGGRYEDHRDKECLWLGNSSKSSFSRHDDQDDHPTHHASTKTNKRLLRWKSTKLSSYVTCRSWRRWWWSFCHDYDGDDHHHDVSSSSNRIFVIHTYFDKSLSHYHHHMTPVFFLEFNQQQLIEFS